jgi:hypothetical protein
MITPTSARLDIDRVLKPAFEMNVIVWYQEILSSKT